MVLLRFLLVFTIQVGITVQNCIVNDLSLQENFNFDKYMGTWHEISWYSDEVIPESTWLTDYIHHHIPVGDGKATVYTQGRKNFEPKVCLFDNYNLTSTETPGKLLLTSYGNEWDETGIALPYWVLDTDYTHYAFVYGCYNVASNGTCDVARAGVWTRTTTLPQNVLDRKTNFHQNICRSAALFENVSFDNLCPLKVLWNLDDRKNCNLTGFSVKSDFNVNMFTRVWYETNRLPTEDPADLVTDRLVEVYVDDKGEVSSYVRQRKGQVCRYATTVFTKTETPGKFIATLPGTFTTSQSSPATIQFWIADTDYESYAVVYGCDLVGPDDVCLIARGSLWSRTPTLASHFQHKANSVLQRLCINPSAFVSSNHVKACPPQPVKECPFVTRSSADSFRAVFNTLIALLFIRIL